MILLLLELVDLTHNHLRISPVKQHFFEDHLVQNGPEAPHIEFLVELDLIVPDLEIQNVRWAVAICYSDVLAYFLIRWR